MKIPFFKNREVVLTPFKLNQNIAKVFKDEVEIKKVESIITNIFILEKDINHSQLNKVIIFKNLYSTTFLFFLNNSTILINEYNYLIELNNYNEENLISLYNEIIANPKSHTFLNPYKLDIMITRIVNSLIKDSISKIFRIINEFTIIRESFLIKSFFKSDTPNVIRYIKNICFKNFDEKLFKDCYAFSLHSDNKKNDMYNILAKNNNVRDNFNKFKKDNSFLAMAFIKQSSSKINLLFSNNYDEDRVYNKIKVFLKKDYPFISDEQFNNLKKKSYNHFLYIKTPDKYFKLLEKSNLKNIDYLNLKQINFLNKIYHKNNTFLNPNQISRIIKNEKTMERFSKILDIRKYIGFEINSQVENIEIFLNKNENLYKEEINFYVSAIKEKNLVTDKFLVFDDFFDKKIKIQNGDFEHLFSDLSSYLLNTKTHYSNSGYIVEAIDYLSKNKVHNIVFIELIEGRQKHFIFLSYNEDNNSFKFSQNCTPRIKAFMNKIISTTEFKNYYFDNFIFVN